MVHLSVDERTFLVEKYLQSKDCDRVLLEFRRRYPNRPQPHRNTVYWNVRKFSNNGTVKNMHKERCGRRRTGRSVGNVNTVRNLLEQNPRISCRKNTSGLPSATFNRIVRLDLKWHPYRIFVRHELKDADYPRRLQFARRFRDSCHNARFLPNIVIGDECSFAMNGRVTTQNVRMYAPVNQPPNFTYEVSNDRSKVTVWAAITGNNSLIGPYFFQGNVNGRTYLDLMNNFALPALAQAYNVNIQDRNAHRLWWFQDGATPHRTRNVKQRIQEIFGQRVVALGHTIEWPARSPDLTPCDFFLWGHIKAKVFQTPPQNIQQLRQRITAAFDDLRQDQNTLQNSMQEMRDRAQTCIDRNGRHVEGH